MEAKPIPAFYCCYLLRSAKVGRSNRHFFYIGSTPHPRRRLAQHNGEADGGAVRTRNQERRPWGMSCVVTGFPSKAAALQFEWAWQNFHVTKKVSDQQREGKARKSNTQSKPQELVETEQSENSVRDQKVQKKKRSQRPQVTLARALTNLQILLRVPSFNRWPLAVRFFCKDVHQKWLDCTKKANGELRKGFHVTIDTRDLTEPTAKAERHVDPQTGHRQKFAPSGIGGVEGIDVSYSGLQAHVKKSIRLLAEQGIKRCSICANDIKSLNSTVVVCPNEECRAMSHMACLAKQRSDDREFDELLPASVRCPLCLGEHLWLDLVKELSIRTRGGKDLAQLTKATPKPKPTASLISMNTPIVESTGSDIKEVVRRQEDELTGIDFLGHDGADDPLPDDWHALEENSDDGSVASTDIACSSHVENLVKPTKQRQQLPVVIEDSDWDSAEVLD